MSIVGPFQLNYFCSIDEELYTYGAHDWKVEL